MKTAKLFSLLLVLLLASGCSYRAGIGTNLAEEKVKNIRCAGENGQFSADDIRARFGEPQMILDLGGGRERWTYLESRVDSLSWLILSGYLIYRPSWVEVKNTMLEVIIKDDKVEKVLFVGDTLPETPAERGETPAEKE
ncbi:MAG: hypothetical protein E3J72_06395 [Planctomycetota bacterium]|nr:MAG: hypothetical protein E3J72_06395 [Planctomycetota bacterium]